MTAEYRRLPLKTLYNCRDLGGYPTLDGKVTRFGVFLRSRPLRAGSGGSDFPAGIRCHRHCRPAQ